MHLHFPGISLFSQFFRQITKPLSKQIVNYASRRPTFRRYFLLIPGRIYFKIERSIEVMKNAKFKTEKQKVSTLSDKKAVEIGSQLMIEVVIFGLLTILMMCEWQRSQWKSEAQEEKNKSSLDFIKGQIDNVGKKIASLENAKKRTETLYYEIKKLMEGDQ